MDECCKSSKLTEINSITYIAEIKTILMTRNEVKYAINLINIVF